MNDPKPKATAPVNNVPPELIEKSRMAGEKFREQMKALKPGWYKQIKVDR